MVPESLLTVVANPIPHLLRWVVVVMQAPALGHIPAQGAGVPVMPTGFPLGPQFTPTLKEPEKIMGGVSIGPSASNPTS